MFCPVRNKVCFHKQVEPRVSDPFEHLHVWCLKKPLPRQKKKCVGKAYNDYDNGCQEQRDMFTLEILYTGIRKPDYNFVCTVRVFGSSRRENINDDTKDLGIKE